MMKLQKSLARVAGTGVGAATALTLVAGPAQAQVTAATTVDPIPAADFSDCPALPPGADPRGSLCLVAVVTSGRLKLGRLNQSITKPIKVAWASAVNAETGDYTTVFGKLRAKKMRVRSGTFGDPISPPVYVRPEWGGSFEPSGVDYMITLKLRLMNPLLGRTCVIRSINLNMITGTTDPPPPNRPISGKPPVLIPDQPVSTRRLTNVDNAFAVPRAKGCGPHSAIVNSQAGLPSAAGRNTAIFNEYGFLKRYVDL